jgi:hypothetical protein
MGDLEKDRQGGKINVEKTAQREDSKGVDQTGKMRYSSGIEPFFVRVPLDVIPLQLRTSEFVGA